MDLICICFSSTLNKLDSVSRRKLPEVMNTMGISQKLVRLIEMAMKGTKAAVKINN
jgi:hypothetical protein